MADRDPDRLEQELGEIARTLTDDDTARHAPPPAIWSAIEAELAAPVSLAQRRQRRIAPLLLAAAAAAVIVVGALVAVDRASEDGSTVLATTTIGNEGLPVPNPDSGTARLVERDGRFELDVDVPDLPDADGFYEIWIIDARVEGMQSLGVLTGDGTFPLPAGIDPADFPVVDVSVEPADGDPTHSGQSIWRGTLDLPQ